MVERAKHLVARFRDLVDVQRRGRAPEVAHSLDDVATRRITELDKTAERGEHPTVVVAQAILAPPVRRQPGALLLPESKLLLEDACQDRACLGAGRSNERGNDLVEGVGLT